MKRFTCLSLLFIVFLSACKQKEVDCMAIAYKKPCYIAFKGFLESDLDTLVRIGYQKGSGFTNRISTDTIFSPDVFLYNDTAYSSATKTCMSTAEADYDYEILLPAVSRTYRIADIGYTTDTVIRWTRKHDCGTHGTFTVNPEFVTIDGINTATTVMGNYQTSWIFLKK